MSKRPVEATPRSNAASRHSWRPMPALAISWPPLHPRTDNPPGSALEIVGKSIGTYKIREKIGEGGMGVLYVAEQSGAVRRKVALKLIKPGLATKDVIARFEVERQALAMMDHPHIARIFDGGVTVAGQPFFVMELVQGPPITHYCDDRKLPPAERLTLFAAVCRAVHHAHQKGIIHRDLKPSNILVPEIDGVAVPKVIDFGVAKAVDQKLSDESVYTKFSQFIGTPSYMSPEQAGLGVVDIDTRSDIYSLGVLLYELLTGTTPFDRLAGNRADYDELRRIIVEQEPPRPSNAISTLQADALSTIADRRRSAPQKLCATLRGELDWIVMKALDKDRNRRYESTLALAADIERYLQGQAVEACPPSTWYRTSRLIKRNWVGFTAAGLVLLALSLGLVGTSWQAIRASRAEQLAASRLVDERRARTAADEQRDRARSEAIRADREANRAREQEQNARTEAAIAKAVNDFLQHDLFVQSTGMSQLEAGWTPDPEITAKTLLDRAGERIGDRFADLPIVEGSIRYTMGNAYIRLGFFEEAGTHLERAVDIGRNVVGVEHLGTVRAIGALASLRLSQSRYAEAERLAVEAVELAAEYGEPDCEEWRDAVGTLVGLHFEQGRHEQAYPLARDLVAACERSCGPEHPATLNALHDLAAQLFPLGRAEEGLQIIERLLVTKKSTLGDSHRSTLETQNSLAAAYDRLGQFAQAEALFRKVVERLEEIYGAEHPTTLRARGNLGRVLHKLDKQDAAESLLTEVLQSEQRVLGERHRQTLGTRGYLADVFTTQERFEEALALQQESLVYERAVFGDGHPSIISTQAACASLLFRLGQEREGEAAYLAAIELARSHLGPDHDSVLTLTNNLAVLYQRGKRYQEALDLFESLARLRRDKNGPYAYATLKVEFNKAYVLRELGSKAEAIELLEDVLARLETHFGEDHVFTSHVRAARLQLRLRPATAKARTVSQGRRGLQKSIREPRLHARARPS